LAPVINGQQLVIARHPSKEVLDGLAHSGNGVPDGKEDGEWLLSDHD
jgi:hypothetical protein